MGLDEAEPEAEVGVGDAIALEAAPRDVRRRVDGDNALLLDERARGPGHRGRSPRPAPECGGDAGEVHDADLVGADRLEDGARAGALGQLAGKVDLGDVGEQGVRARQGVLDEPGDGPEAPRMGNELGNPPVTSWISKT